MLSLLLKGQLNFRIVPQQVRVNVKQFAAKESQPSEFSRRIPICHINKFLLFKATEFQSTRIYVDLHWYTFIEPQNSIKKKQQQRKCSMIMYRL